MDGIKVKVFDIRNGMRVYDNIKIIRIISKDYNLLIMKDYLPIIGEIEGSVDIKNDVVNESFKNIKAFYMNSERCDDKRVKCRSHPEGDRDTVVYGHIPGDS